MKIRIGSRGSKLAVAQARWVGAELKKKTPELEIEFQTIVTTGDKDMAGSLSAIGGKGVFVKEIEDALRRNEIDLAVHSLKDVPQMLPPGLRLGATPQRETPFDVVVSRFGEQLQELPKGSIIGTGSPRRQAQIAHRFKRRSFRLEGIRGNVETRLRKVHEGHYDAIVLAHAGLTRIGLAGEITQVLTEEEMLPAPGQGCLGLELRESDETLLKFLETIKDASSDAAARAERAFLSGLGGDCLIPVGALATVQGGELHMRALLAHPSGETMVESREQGPVEQPEYVGSLLAERLLFEGGSELLAEIDKGAPSA